MDNNFEPGSVLCYENFIVLRDITFTYVNNTAHESQPTRCVFNKIRPKSIIRKDKIKKLVDTLFDFALNHQKLIQSSAQFHK